MPKEKGFRTAWWFIAHSRKPAAVEYCAYLQRNLRKCGLRRRKKSKSVNNIQKKKRSLRKTLPRNAALIEKWLYRNK